MSGWEDWIFRNLPAPPLPSQDLPARPTSQGSLLGMQGSLLGMQGSSIGANYQGLPTSQHIDDRQGEPTDQAYWMKNSDVGADPAAPPPYSPSAVGGGPVAGVGSGEDLMMTAQATADPTGNVPADVAPYRPSFKPNWRPSPYNRPAPYNPFGGLGPNLPRGPQGTSMDPQMPYMGAHLPISPGDPGWTPPPSPSGPHTRNPEGEGDPDRPGYGSPVMPMNLRSAAGGNASQPSYQQLINFLQSRGGTS